MTRRLPGPCGRSSLLCAGRPTPVAQEAAATDRRRGGFPRAEVLRLFDAYAVVQAQEALGAGQRALRHVRVGLQGAARDAASPSRTARAPASPNSGDCVRGASPDETAVRDRLKALQDQDTRAAGEVAQALDAAGPIADLVQRGAFPCLRGADGAAQAGPAFAGTGRPAGNRPPPPRSLIAWARPASRRSPRTGGQRGPRGLRATLRNRSSADDSRPLAVRTRSRNVRPPLCAAAHSSCQPGSLPMWRSRSGPPMRSQRKILGHPAVRQQHALSGSRLTPVTEAELNSYIRFSLASQIPTGVVEPYVTILGGDQVRGRAVVDLDLVRKSKSRGWLDPLAYLSGRVPVTASGVPAAADGSAQLELSEATIAGVPSRSTVLQELVSYYSRSPNYPRASTSRRRSTCPPASRKSTSRLARRSSCSGDRRAGNPTRLRRRTDLDAPVATLRGVGDRRARELARAGMATVGDLLLRLPFRYEDRATLTPIGSLRPPGPASACGDVVRCALRTTRRPGFTIFEALVRDASGMTTAVWFNQRYLRDVFAPGQRVVLYGPVEARGLSGVQFNEPALRVRGRRPGRCLRRRGPHRPHRAGVRAHRRPDPEACSARSCTARSQGWTSGPIRCPWRSASDSASPRVTWRFGRCTFRQSAATWPR